MERFRSFLINEERSYLGHRIGDVLTSVQDLQGDMENLGSRHLARLAENIVNQIRKVLHSRWNPKYNNQLKDLQKIAVAIQKTIDERGDLKQILPAASQELENLSGKLGVKVNNLKAPEDDSSGEDEIAPQDFQPTEPPPSEEQNPQEVPPQMPQANMEPASNQPQPTQPQMQPNAPPATDLNLPSIN
jgi:hypothetical protein